MAVFQFIGVEPLAGDPERAPRGHFALQGRGAALIRGQVQTGAPFVARARQHFRQSLLEHGEARHAGTIGARGMLGADQPHQVHEMRIDFVLQ